MGIDQGRRGRHQTAHSGRKSLGRPRCGIRRYQRARPDLHRFAPGARSHQPAGFRRPTPGRPAGAPPDLTLATEDHNVPTIDIDKPIADPVSRTQVETLRRNCAEFGVRLYPMGDVEQGIVHVVGPQLGLTQPGMTVVCGDSHTSTHGAFGALAMGIGTSEVEHVLATQTLPLRPFKTMAVNVDGELPAGVTAKDIILALIAKIGTGGGQGMSSNIAAAPSNRCRWKAG